MYQRELLTPVVCVTCKGTGVEVVEVTRVPGTAFRYKKKRYQARHCSNPHCTAKRRGAR
jgi:hypothetical protein